MKNVFLALLVGGLLAQPVYAQRPPKEILTELETTHARESELIAELKVAIKPAPVASSAELASALVLGGDVYLKADTDYPGSFVVTKPTNLIAEGLNSRLTGSTAGPALRILASHVYASGFQASTPHPNAVISIGTGLETTVEQTPEDVVITHVTVDNYRGKRAIAIHGRNVRVLQNQLTNIWIGGQDSQAVWVGNAPCRPCVIDGNELSAGSEVIMVGGSIMAIPDVHPANIQITRNHLFRPESWRTDGISRGVKNLLELKDGGDVLIADNDMEGSWVNGQDGPAVVLTPKSGGDVQHVVIERNRITRAGYGFQMAAADYHLDSPPTPEFMGDVVIRDNSVSVSTKMGWTSADGVWHGSRGILALVLGSVQGVTFENNTAILDGGGFILADSRGSYLGLDGVLHPNPPISALTIINNQLVAGSYGLIIGSAMTNLATPPRTDLIDVLTVTGNTIADGPAWLKKYFPLNTYVTRAEWDALFIK